MRIIGGLYRGKKIATPLSGDTRPTSDRAREMIFNILCHNPSFGPQVLVGRTVLDVFSGTGALGLEALSRGAKSIQFIENNKAILPTLYRNVKEFHLPLSSIIEQDVHHLKRSPISFDLVFLDPPYHKRLLPPALERLSSQGWFSKNAALVIEMAKDEDLPLGANLSLVTERLVGAAKLLFCRAV
jgi:16S rRNA (guanine966-N2)-methyltransferase